MTDERLSVDKLVEIPVNQLHRFLKFIGEHDLWEELAQHLRDRGCDKLLMSLEPVKEIGRIVQAKSSEMASRHERDRSLPPGSHLRCGCGGSGSGSGSGPSDGGLPPGGAPDGGVQRKSQSGCRDSI